MKVVGVLAALGTLCSMLPDVSADESPKIVGPDHIQLKVCPGKQLVLDCKAYPNCEDDLTLIYWLVNGSFLEIEFDDGRMTETEESTSEGGAILQRSLMVKNVTSEDFNSTFTCVVTNPAGIAQKYITLESKNNQ
ncbi:interleukin-1 receptor type 2-like [Lampris incognitus]|uniref:interleukin-1 receptor type 2-like n=1 Tax=Lampris incognitus TaxID=2546036 RepID=UPI0024B488C0|nr:interleukin-1 receptor type 2-like [Lampris incognitus]